MNNTGLRVQVNLGGLSVDQLALKVSNSTRVLTEGQLRPVTARGPLPDPQIIDVYLPDALNNTSVTCDVFGLFGGATVGAGTINAKVTAHHLTLVSVPLTHAAADGGADAKPDGAGGDANLDGGPPDGGPPDAPAVDTGLAPLGTMCADGTTCASGLCVDGVCCESTCGNCRACNVGSKAGTCAPVAMNTKSAMCANQASACGYNGTCDGQGGCFRPPAGQPCSDPTCQGSTLQPSGACDGQGACVPAVAVSCAPFNCDATGGAHCRMSCAVQADCVTTAQCQNGSCGQKPKKANGAGCSADADCLSNVCADGVCCNARCAGQCESCNVTGQAGTCTAVPAGKNDPHGLCKDAGAASCGTSGLCDGARGCSRYPANTVCDPAQCQAQMVLFDKRCNNAGVCMGTGSKDCGQFRCDPSTVACFTSCMTDAECAMGKHCRGGMCK